MHANTLFEALFETSHLFSDRPLYGHMVASELLWNYEFIIAKIYFY